MCSHKKIIICENIHGSIVAAYLKTFILTSVDVLLILSLLGADEC